MSDYAPGELAWFVHPEHGSQYALAFIRDHKSGAYVFGGHTCAHYTGHGERWTKKLAEIERLGYLPLPEARSGGVVPQGWQPPEQEAEREVVIARINAGEL